MYKNTLNDSRIKYVHVLLLFIAIQFLSGNMCHMVISVVTNIPFTLEDIFQLDYNSYVIYEIILSLILLTVLNVKSASSSKMRIIKQKLYLTIWFISIGLCLLLVQLHFNEKESLSIIVLANASILLYLSFIMFSFFRETIIVKNENEKINEEYRISKIKLQSLIETERNYEEFQKYKHDIKNNLLTLSYLQNSDDFDKAKDYLNKLVNRFENTNSSYQLSNHPIINAILIDKKRKNKDIEFIFKCSCSNELFVDDLDLNILLSNLFDNAIEYLKLNDVENKFINVKIIERGDVFIISVKNPVIDTFKHTDELKTTKQDKKNHGYGISIIKNIVNKYNGYIEFENEKGFFVVNILLKG